MAVSPQASLPHICLLFGVFTAIPHWFGLLFSTLAVSLILTLSCDGVHFLADEIHVMLINSIFAQGL